MVNRINLFESLKDQYKIKFENNPHAQISASILKRSLIEKENMMELTLMDMYSMCFVFEGTYFQSKEQVFNFFI